MSDYLDVGQFKQTSGGKWRFIRLGSAKKNDKGQLDIWLDALPIADDKGNCRLTVTKRDDTRQQQSSGQQSGGYAGAPGLDDEIPFGPEVRA